MEKEQEAPTVRLEISVVVRQEGYVLDTELTVEEWNALTDEERQKFYDDTREELVTRDDGGVVVLTPGAVGI